MKEVYLIVGLLLIIIFLLSKQQQKQEEKEKEEKIDEIYKPIRYWAPGHLTSYYYPFRVPLRFRRHHRFHRRNK